MNKFIKIILLFISAIWVIISSVFTILVLKNGWEKVQRDEWYELMAFKLDRDPNEHKLDIKFDTIPDSFPDRIKNLAFDEDLDAIEKVYKSSNISLPKTTHDELLNAFNTVFTYWPQLLKDFANQHIAGVFILKGIPSSARIFQMSESEQFTIVINEDVLSQSANEWMTTIEHTAIKETISPNRLSIKIENTDAPVYTLENILIHELGHAFGVVNMLTTNFNYTLKNEQFSFYSESHIPRIVMEPKDIFLDRYDVLTYYGKSTDKISFDQYKELVLSLDQTPYPTMYGAKNPLEFFAEIFYSYVHCVIQKKPYETKLREKGKETVIPNGILSDRCKTQYQIIDQHFQNTTKM